MKVTHGICLCQSTASVSSKTSDLFNPSFNLLNFFSSPQTHLVILSIFIWLFPVIMTFLSIHDFFLYSYDFPIFIWLFSVFIWLCPIFMTFLSIHMTFSYIHMNFLSEVFIKLHVLCLRLEKMTSLWLIIHCLTIPPFPP